MKKKKYMIRCDIEGVTGVVSYDQAEPGKAEYAFGQRMFLSDLNACIEGLLKGGADEIVIYDEHYYGRNIDPGLLPENVSCICGKPPYKAEWAGGLDDTFAGVILLGFHSKYGTVGGLLHHSYELDICDILLNDVSVGEIGNEAAVAGDWGVPVLLVTGDSAGIAEAQALLPNVCGVIVKESLSESGALCFSTEVTSKLIRSAAESIVKKPPEVKPYCVGNDVTMKIVLNDGPYLQAVQRECGDKMSDGKSLTFKGSSATAVWAEYWQMKLHCQKTMG